MRTSTSLWQSFMVLLPVDVDGPIKLMPLFTWDPVSNCGLGEHFMMRMMVTSEICDLSH